MPQRQWNVIYSYKAISFTVEEKKGMNFKVIYILRQGQVDRQVYRQRQVRRYERKVAWLEKIHRGQINTLISNSFSCNIKLLFSFTKIFFSPQNTFIIEATYNMNIHIFFIPDDFVLQISKLLIHNSKIIDLNIFDKNQREKHNYFSLSFVFFPTSILLLLPLSGFGFVFIQELVIVFAARTNQT